MPDWHQINSDLKTIGSAYDIVRRKYLAELSEFTERNVIIYYSGWLQKPDAFSSHLNDEDKNGFMTVIHGLDKSKGLDLLLHTPGGETAATESLVDYIRSFFGTNIRAIIPQLAMSAGTMIACACKEIVMGKHSSLGPIDPIYMGLPAHGVVEEFERAYREIKNDPSKVHIWQPIISKYHPSLIGECEKSLAWSREIVVEWLISGMLSDIGNKKEKAEKIVDELADHALTKSHSRHLSARKCLDIGLKVTLLEDNNKFQDKVLSVHHACIHTLSATPAFKIIENQNGVAYIKIAKHMIIQK